MEKKTKATDVKKDAALKESFAEIKKAVVETAKATEKKLTPKKEAVKEAVKDAVKEAAPKKAPEKKTAPAKKTTATEKAPAEAPKAAVKAALTLQIDGKDYDPEKILADCTAAAEKVKKDVADVKVYVNVNDKAAYYTVDGEGKPEYKISL